MRFVETFRTEAHNPKSYGIAPLENSVDHAGEKYVRCRFCLGNCRNAW